jgi:excisionase family DNA binding protein
MDSKQVYSVRETAELLGVSQETIRRAIRSGRLKAAKFGGKDLRISRHDIAEFYRRQGGTQLFHNLQSADQGEEKESLGREEIKHLVVQYVTEALEAREAKGKKDQGSGPKMP